MSDKTIDLLVFIFVVVTISMIVSGVVLALYFNSIRWLLLCIPIILYLS